ncbi:hypothetical protein GCM10009077_11080 [Roseibium denhamense]
MRCSQADHSVTGCIGSVHPIGHPMIQSEKFGLKVSMPVEDLGPDANFKWSGREQGKFTSPAGAAFQLRINSHICVQSRAALPRAICAPFCVGSFLNLMPF